MEKIKQLGLRIKENAKNWWAWMRMHKSAQQPSQQSPQAAEKKVEPTPEALTKPVAEAAMLPADAMITPTERKITPEDYLKGSVIRYITDLSEDEKLSLADVLLKCTDKQRRDIIYVLPKLSVNSAKLLVEKLGVQRQYPMNMDEGSAEARIRNIFDHKEKRYEWERRMGRYLEKFDEQKSEFTRKYNKLIENSLGRDRLSFELKLKSKTIRHDKTHSFQEKYLERFLDAIDIAVSKIDREVCPLEAKKKQLRGQTQVAEPWIRRAVKKVIEGIPNFATAVVTASATVMGAVIGAAHNWDWNKIAIWIDQKKQVIATSGLSAQDAYYIFGFVALSVLITKTLDTTFNYFGERRNERKIANCDAEINEVINRYIPEAQQMIKQAYLEYVISVCLLEPKKKFRF